MGSTFILIAGERARAVVPDATWTARRNSPASDQRRQLQGDEVHYDRTRRATNVIALQPQYILFADDGGVTIDASTRSVAANGSARPASPADATTVYASISRRTPSALRAERFVNWKRVGTNTVKYLTAAAWPAPSGVEEPQTASGRTKNGH